MTGHSVALKILVLFHSRTGNTMRLAAAIAGGARRIVSAEVDLWRVPEIVAEEELLQHPHYGPNFLEFQHIPIAQPEDLVVYDAIVIGAPVRMGSMCGEVKYFIDRMGSIWQQGTMRNKVGAAFTTASTQHGGHEVTTLDILHTMMHLGMIIVTPGYTDPIYDLVSTPYGATAVTKPARVRVRPNDDQLEGAAKLGVRVATIALWLKQGRQIGVET